MAEFVQISNLTIDRSKVEAVKNTPSGVTIYTTHHYYFVERSEMSPDKVFKELGIELDIPF